MPVESHLAEREAPMLTWLPPALGFIKINVDVGSDKRYGNGAMAGVARDRSGNYY